MVEPLWAEVRGRHTAAASEPHAGSSRLREATFKRVAEGFIASQESGWRNPKLDQQWVNTLATNFYPAMGDLPVSVITT